MSNMATDIAGDKVLDSLAIYVRKDQIIKFNDFKDKFTNTYLFEMLDRIWHPDPESFLPLLDDTSHPNYLKFIQTVVERRARLSKLDRPAPLHIDLMSLDERRGREMSNGSFIQRAFIRAVDRISIEKSFHKYQNPDNNLAVIKMYESLSPTVDPLSSMDVIKACSLIIDTILPKTTSNE